MKTLKLDMAYKNYMCIGSTHIFINFNNTDLEHLNSMNPKSIHKIHVFITNHAAIGVSLKFMVDKYGKLKIDGVRYPVKIVIHLPVKLKELAPLIGKVLGSNNVFAYKHLVERKGPRFIITNENYKYSLLITYGEKGIKVTTTGSGMSCPISIKFPEYEYDLIDEENDPGIFETGDMRLHPSDFKDKLIDGFKKSCPENILKTFKTDTDIWDYIMQQGSWGLEKDMQPVGLSKTSTSLGLIKDRSSIMVVDGNAGTGVSSLAKILAESGMKGIQVVQAGDKILDSNNKFVMCDSFSQFAPDLPVIPPKPMMEEFDSRPRNREERRRGRRL